MPASLVVDVAGAPREPVSAGCRSPPLSHIPAGFVVFEPLLAWESFRRGTSRCLGRVGGSPARKCAPSLLLTQRGGAHSRPLHSTAEPRWTVGPRRVSPCPGRDAFRTRGAELVECARALPVSNGRAPEWEVSPSLLSPGRRGSLMSALDLNAKPVGSPPSRRASLLERVFDTVDHGRRDGTQGRPRLVTRAHPRHPTVPRAPRAHGQPLLVTDRHGRLPGLLLEWRRTASGWQGRVVRPVLEAGS